MKGGDYFLGTFSEILHLYSPPFSKEKLHLYSPPFIKEKLHL